MGRAKGINDNFADVLGLTRGTGKEDTPAKPCYNQFTDENHTLIEEYRAWENGPLHREDGPAVIEHRTDGSKEEIYFHYGKQHRLDGPAVILTDAEGQEHHAYYIDDKLQTNWQAIKDRQQAN